jgi:hypothetical protein
MILDLFANATLLDEAMTGSFHHFTLVTLISSSQQNAKKRLMYSIQLKNCIRRELSVWQAGPFYFQYKGMCAYTQLAYSH